MPSLSWIVSSLILLNILQSQICDSVGNNCSGCTFYQHKHVSNALTKLEPLCGRRFTLDEPERTNFKYAVGICTSAEIMGKSDTAGVVQMQKFNNKTKFTLGDLRKADVMSGKNWVMLQYDGGDDYSQSCGKSQRKVVIMITCDPTAPKLSTMKFIEENNNKSEDCYYLFQLEDSSVCASIEPKKEASYLSAGSILSIVFFSFVSIYLVVGFIIQRFIRGARGANQIPNVEFWKELGSLMADGCDLMCRCGRERDSYLDDRGHRSRSDALLENARDHVDVDDGLLGM